MAGEVIDIPIGQFETVFQLLMSSTSLQSAVIILIAGIILITTIYKKFSSIIKSHKINYEKPHLASFIRVALLPFFAIILISSINIYIQVFELFENDNNNEKLNPQKTFVKILNTLNILVIGYTVSQLIPIILDKHRINMQDKEDFEIWKEMQGFDDDENDLFYKIFKWVPPKTIPDGITEKQFQKYLSTDQGKKVLQNFRTSKGLPIGTYKKIISKPFEGWRKSERKKYLKYYECCVNGYNDSGQKLKLGNSLEEVYSIDIWKEQKKLNSYEHIIPGSKPPGYAKKSREGMPRSIKQIIPVVIFALTILSIVSWWGIDLVVLATATGGLALGIGLALKDTAENYFAYVFIRKDKTFKEGDMVKLISQYRGYVHKITPRVTYVRHPLKSEQIINYTKENNLFPVITKMGVSYLNNPKQVIAILIKVGQRAMKEIKDVKNRHMIRQNKCPYINENKQSCGCDRDLHIDIQQPIVRFNEFNDSALDFSMWVYVKDYGSQFKVKSDIHIIIFDEFKKHDVRIPWPIRTIYNSDEKTELNEIAKLDKEREEILKKHGMGDL